VRASLELEHLRHGLPAARREPVVVGPVARRRSRVHDVVAFRSAGRAFRRLGVVLATQHDYQLLLSLTDPRDNIVLLTELNDLCDRLQWPSVGARRYCQLS